MTAVHWLNAVNGSFTNPSDWSGGVVPGATDDAIIDAVGAAPYTVSASGAVTVNSLQTGAQATVAISHALFTTSAGTGAGVNAGEILVGVGATLAASGTIDNTGLIQLGSGKGADAILADGALTLSGGGRVFMTDSEQNAIGGVKGASLVNLDNTIFGSGTIGSRRFAVTNGVNGVIDATGALALTIVSGVANDGVVEATGKGGLYVRQAEIQNGASGIVLASNSTIWLQSATMYGGAVETAGAGSVTLAAGKLRGVTNDGNLSVAGYSVWEDGLDNHGSISLAGVGYSTRFLGDTLSGSGTVVLAQHATLGLALNVDNTISGSGIVEAGNYNGLELANGAAGVIEADGAGSLVLFARTITNAGLMESNGAAGSSAYLRLDANQIANTGTFLSAGGSGPMEIQGHIASTGLISSVGLGGAVLTGAIQNNGVLSVSGGGAMSVLGKVTGSGHASIDDATLIFASTFSQDVTFTGGAGELDLGLSESFSKTIAGFSATGATLLDLGDISFVDAGEATYTGDKHGGILTVTDGIYTAHIRFAGDYRHATFAASSDGDHGTIIVAEPDGAHGLVQSAAPHLLIAAMAALGASSAVTFPVHEPPALRTEALAGPRTAIA